MAAATDLKSVLLIEVWVQVPPAPPTYKQMKTTQRQDKRHSKKSKEKELIALERRLNQLWEAKRAYKLVKLDKPIPWGWKRKFTLREDVKGRSDIKIIREILDRVNSTVYCRNRKFLQYNYKTDKYEPMSHGTKSIPENKWSFPESYKRFFDFRVKERKGHFCVLIDKGYHFKFDWMLVTKTEPHFATHVIIPDGELESELKKINNKMDRDMLWAKLAKIHGHSFHYKDRWGSNEKGRESNDRHKEIKEALIECEDSYE